MYEVEISAAMYGNREDDPSGKYLRNCRSVLRDAHMRYSKTKSASSDEDKQDYIIRPVKRYYMASSPTPSQDGTGSTEKLKMGGGDGPRC